MDDMFQKIDELFSGMPNVFGIADDMLIASFDEVGKNHDIIVYLALLKITLVDAYMYIYCPACMTICHLQYMHMFIYTEVVYSSRLYT